MAAIRRRCGFGEGRFRLGLIGFLDSRTHSPVDEAFILREAASKLGLARRSLILIGRFKIDEEADELCRTLEENENPSRTASEMADVLYHSMVLLAQKGVKVEDALQVLRLRFAQSGIEEKSSRNS